MQESSFVALFIILLWRKLTSERLDMIKKKKVPPIFPLAVMSKQGTGSSRKLSCLLLVAVGQEELVPTLVL